MYLAVVMQYLENVKLLKTSTSGLKYFTRHLTVVLLLVLE